MKKYFELFVNASLIISIFAISPGLLLNGDKVANDSINYWFGNNMTISSTAKIRSMEDLQNQPVSAAQNEQTFRTIFEDN